MKKLLFFVMLFALPSFFVLGNEIRTLNFNSLVEPSTEVMGIPIDIDYDLGGGCRIRAVGSLGLLPLRYTGTITITGPCQGTYNVDGVSGPAVGTGTLSEAGLISNFYFESSDSQFEDFINSDLIRLTIIAELERAIAENK